MQPSGTCDIPGIYSRHLTARQLGGGWEMDVRLFSQAVVLGEAQTGPRLRNHRSLNPDCPLCRERWQAWLIARCRTLLVPQFARRQPQTQLRRSKARREAGDRSSGRKFVIKTRPG
jgi:hypothetical protein